MPTECKPLNMRKVERRSQMKLTKILALLLAVVMILAMAAGCGSKGETPSDTPADNPATDAPANFNNEKRIFSGR